MHQRAVNVAWGGPPDLTTKCYRLVPLVESVIYPHHLKHASLEPVEHPAVFEHYGTAGGRAGDGCPSATAIIHWSGVKSTNPGW
jgi:hypothetical protein